jgi:glutaredoxin 3
MADSARVVMYATDWCGYCARARRLLESKGIAFTEIDVDAVAGARAEMQRLSGRTSVPQIFIDGRHIGGYDDTKALDDAGGLDPLLNAATEA